MREVSASVFWSEIPIWGEELTLSLDQNDDWWGIKFLDPKYLMNWTWSPDLILTRDENLCKVRISGNDHLEPQLSWRQISSLKFLGWRADSDLECDCLFLPEFVVEESAELISRALTALSVIYGVSDNAVLVGSDDRVSRRLDHMAQMKYSRKYGGFCPDPKRVRIGDLR